MTDLVERMHGLSPAQIIVEETRGWEQRQMSARETSVVEDLDVILGTDDVESVARRVGYTGTNAMLAALRKWEQDELVRRVLRQKEGLR